MPQAFLFFGVLALWATKRDGKSLFFGVFKRNSIVFSICFNFCSGDAPPRVCAGQKIICLKKSDLELLSASVGMGVVQSWSYAFFAIENGSLRVELWPSPVSLFR